LSVASAGVAQGLSAQPFAKQNTFQYHRAPADAETAWVLLALRKPLAYGGIFSARLEISS
jgi:hypothetical protein